MTRSTLSPAAYRLRSQWEAEDCTRFRRFRRDAGSMQVINALAELIAHADADRPIHPIHF